MTNTNESILLSRAVGGDATREDWDELTARADERPQLWQRLGETLRDQTGAVRAVEAASRIADTVEIPAIAPRGVVPPDDPPLRGVLHRWSGWAVAAAVGLAWIMNLTGSPASPGQPQLAELLPMAAASDLFQAYLDKGREDATVIGEVPEKIVVDSRTLPTGDGYELLYLRQILERTVVPDLYHYTGRDEMGRPVLVKYQHTGHRPM